MPLLQPAFRRPVQWLPALWGFVILVLLMGAHAQGATGRTPGQFSVDATGAATYSIPLWSPPGVAGMAPQLALVYHSRAGNGPLGVGWGPSRRSTTRASRRSSRAAP